MSHWNEIDSEAAAVETYLYGDPDLDIDDYWLGERDLTEVICS